MKPIDQSYIDDPDKLVGEWVCISSGTSFQCIMFIEEISSSKEDYLTKEYNGHNGWFESEWWVDGVNKWFEEHNNKNIPSQFHLLTYDEVMLMIL
jgi:hypothetical protein